MRIGMGILKQFAFASAVSLILISVPARSSSIPSVQLSAIQLTGVQNETLSIRATGCPKYCKIVEFHLVVKGKEWEIPARAFNFDGNVSLIGVAFFQEEEPSGIFSYVVEIPVIQLVDGAYRIDTVSMRFKDGAFEESEIYRSGKQELE